MAEIVGFIVIFIYTKIVCKNSNGKLNDVFLIESNSPNLLYDVSFQANIDNAVKIPSEVIALLKSNKVAEWKKLHRYRKRSGEFILTAWTQKKFELITGIFF